MYEILEKFIQCSEKCEPAASGDSVCRCVYMVGYGKYIHIMEYIYNHTPNFIRDALDNL